MRNGDRMNDSSIYFTILCLILAVLVVQLTSSISMFFYNKYVLEENARVASLAAEHYRKEIKGWMIICEERNEEIRKLKSKEKNNERT